MKIPNPPIKLCSSIIEFLYEFDSRKKECKFEVLKKHFELTPDYFNRALSFLSDHELISNTGLEVISLSPKSFDSLKKSAGNSRKLVLEEIMKIQPFIEFTYFLGKGKSEEESVKLATSLYDLRQKNESILKIFKEWLKHLNIKISKKPPRNKTLDGIKNSLQSRLYANNFLKEFFGNDLRNIPAQVISELAEGIKNISKDNDLSVNESGRALEDFLRTHASDVDLTDCSGIAQIGSKLNKHDDRYPQKLNNICVGLSNIRSMGKAHGLDKKLRAKWDITDDVAIGYIIIVLALIRSYFTFKQEAKLIF